MQYCAYPSPGISAGCSNKTVHNSMGWYHFSSADLVTWSDEGEALHTDGVGCPTAAAALEALYEESRRCHGERRRGGSASVDYEAMLAMLGEARLAVGSASS